MKKKNYKKSCLTGAIKIHMYPLQGTLTKSKNNATPENNYVKLKLCIYLYDCK